MKVRSHVKTYFWNLFNKADREDVVFSKAELKWMKRQLRKIIERKL